MISLLAAVLTVGQKSADLPWWETARLGLAVEQVSDPVELVKTARLTRAEFLAVDSPDEELIEAAKGKIRLAQYRKGFYRMSAEGISGGNLVRRLIDTSGIGKTLVLSIDPERDQKQLKQFGDWMAKNSAGIIGTSAGPYKAFPWGRVTQRTMKDTTRLYLDVFDWPKNGELTLPGLQNEPLAARSVGVPHRRHEVRTSLDDVVVFFSSHADDPISSTIQVDIAGKPIVRTKG
jgi:hypothetical protein